ncbi:hypothetical protein [Sedimenticola sp.]|uniref:hypothetical protein n=1 Tax=Sedimenticola sp. TaxID=1940285 RepID=UPI003D12423E
MAKKKIEEFLSCIAIPFSLSATLFPVSGAVTGLIFFYHNNDVLFYDSTLVVMPCTNKLFKQALRITVWFLLDVFHLIDRYLTTQTINPIVYCSNTSQMS